MHRLLHTAAKKFGQKKAKRFEQKVAKDTKVGEFLGAAYLVWIVNWAAMVGERVNLREISRRCAETEGSEDVWREESEEI